MAYYFIDLPESNRITYVKREFINILKNIFEDPRIMHDLVSSKKISIKQSKLILKSIEKFNSTNCLCCRKFDNKKIKFSPVEDEFEPLLDLALEAAKSRLY